MRPTTKEKLPSFLQRGKKHRVRKGLSEALGVLGIRGEGEEGGLPQQSILDL